MSKKFNKILSIGTFIALVLAIIIGFAIPNFATSIKFIGDCYITALKVIISPVIFCSISLIILNKEGKGKFLVSKTILLFIVMFVVTFLLSSLIVSIAKPGVNFNIKTPEKAASYADFGILSVLKNLLPKSLKDIFYGKCVFFVIVVALLFSFILSKTKARKDCAELLARGKKHIDFILNVIIFLTPLAVLSLVSNLIANYSVETFKLGLIYVVFAYAISILIVLLVMILPVWIFAKINPLIYIKKIAKVWLISISTCSSVATLPHTIKTCNEDFGVDEKITNIVVPLGCTIHMCGGAVSFSLLGLFVAQLNGIPVTFPMFMLMLLSATLINMAAPGIPGGGKVIGMTYLSIFGFPIEAFYGLYVAIYTFLDMSYTTLNVTGDVSANILLNHLENKRLEKNK